AIGIAANAVLFPLYMSIMGKPQLPSAAFVAYLISTITFNAIKPVVTLIPSALLVSPLQKALK
ncbi:MAG TPA: hypothetical protein DCP97_02935, partial [Ruminococcaceae bacterium]|nr:hypothetical protein [Oscillospiraceae bacterium]